MSSTPKEDLLVHWADITADRIIKQRGEKDCYVLASGITPSGVVHFGNFRETITVDMVARGLKARGKKVRFIFSWDDYDTFRKVPKNMPKQDELEKFLFNPIVDTPDPFDCHESYARHNEATYEAQLDKLGINVEALYQAKKYRAGEYAGAIKHTLAQRQTLMDILNKHRTADLVPGWMPVSIYCANCNRDKVKNIVWDGDDKLDYLCELCNHQGSEKISTSKRVKLPWRMDWPMRWVHEKVDFEPGGKDHSSEGGSFSTGQEIVAQVYGGKAPIYLQYDFVSIKGGKGKMSSSSGELVTVNDVLEVYEPEMIRWIFASYKTNIDFAVSFDLDVIKTYEDFDRQERQAYGLEPGNDKKLAMARRVYELSQIAQTPATMPFQPSFRHLTNILQINGGDLTKARSFYSEEIKNERDERRFRERSLCALNWLNMYAPDDFKFSLNQSAPAMELSPVENNFLKSLVTTLEQSWSSNLSDKELHELIYSVINAQTDLEANGVFTMLYRALISKEKGPKLAGFLQIVGKEKTLLLLKGLL